MLKKLKDILNAYTDEELENMDLWVNSSRFIVHKINELIKNQKKIIERINKDE